MKKSIDTKLALYPTPVTVIGTMNGDKPTCAVLLFGFPSCDRRSDHRGEQGGQDRNAVAQGIGAPVRSGQVQDLRVYGRDHLQQLVQRCLYPDSSQPDERHGKYDQIHQDSGN